MTPDGRARHPDHAARPCRRASAPTSCSPTASSPRSGASRMPRARRSSTPTASSRCPASSTCTRTCASRATSRARPCSPARRPPRPAASPRCSRWRTPSRSPTPPASSSRWPASVAPRGYATVQPDRRGHGRPRGRAARRARRDGPLAGERARLLRRRLLRLRPAAHAPRPRVRQGVRRRDRPARPGAAAHRRARR